MGWMNDHLPFGNRSWRQQPAGQSSKRAASLIDPADYMQPALTAKNPPSRPAIRLPQTPAPAPTLHQAPSGWVEDMTPMGQNDPGGYNIDAAGGIEPAYSAPPPEEPRSLFGGGYMPPQPAPPVSAMDMMASPGTQQHIGNLFDAALGNYSAVRNMQWQDAMKARRQAGWDGFLHDFGVPLAGALGLDPTMAESSLASKVKAGQAAGIPYDPSTLLKDADMFTKLGTTTDPTSLKNQRAAAQVETENARGNKLNADAGSNRIAALAKQQTADARAQYLENKSAQGWTQQDREDFKAQLLSDVQHGKLDALQAQTLMKQAESEAKVNHINADTERIGATTQKIHADISNNHQRLQNDNQRLQLEKGRLEVLKQRANDFNHWKEIDAQIKQINAKQRANYQQFKQDSINAWRAHQTNTKGKLVAPGFDEWVNQLEQEPNPYGDEEDDALPPPSTPAPTPARTKPPAKQNILQQLKRPAAKAQPAAVAKPKATVSKLSADQRAELIRQLKGA